jgi:uncharacterized membrane protein YphA (DoxX/SURF4 family)
VTATGLLIARLCLATVFLYSGVDKLLHWRATLVEVEGYGLPAQPACAALTIVVQLAGGLMVATGYHAGGGALLLAGFTVAATLAAHRFWQHSGDQFRHGLTVSLEHLAIVGGLLMVVLLA